MLTHARSLALLIVVSMPIFAEEELDWELEFGIQQKSTIEDFPLKQIGAEELSDAAIAGGLQSTSAGQTGGSGKPAFEEQKEDANKRQKSELDIEQDSLSPDDILRFSQGVPDPVPYSQGPLVIPNGRTYGQLNNSAFERP